MGGRIEMKFAYAFRRTAFYPYDGGTGWEIPPKEVRGKYLQKVREIGFEGIEVGLGQGVGTSAALTVCSGLDH